MSYLLECLGRGLLGNLLDAFETQLPTASQDQLEALAQRREDSPTSADLAVRLGVACLRSLRLTDARHAFESARELAPDAVAPVLGLACVYDELGEIDGALRCLAIAQAHDPADPAIAFALGFVHERRGDADAAEANYRRAVELCPRLRNGHERLAALALKRSDWESAARCYEQLAELEPNDLDVLLTLGNLALQAGQPLAGIDHFQKALLIEPECGESPFDAAASAASDGRLRHAVDTIQRLMKKYPGVAEFHVHLGDVYVKLDDDCGAIREYEAALEMQPNFLEATVKLGTQHLRKGRFVDAAQSFNRAVELNDRLMTAFVGLGVAQRAAGRDEEARATFDLAASLEPNTTLLFSEAARLQLRDETTQHARQLGGHDEPADGPRAPAPLARATPLDSNELLREAARRHEQAIRQSPNYADLHYRYGLLLRQLGDFAPAVDAFRRAIEINPNYVKALIKLGVCLKESGECDAAIDAFQKALTLRSDYVDVHYQLGLLFAQRNQFDLAVEHFEHAVAGNSRNLAFRQNLALALQSIGMVDKAAATWRSICELARSEPALGRGVKIGDSLD
ncbi:MAG: tetratricopeptide repeat protein [Phycisphaerae bacterium]